MNKPLFTGLLFLMSSQSMINAQLEIPVVKATSKTVDVKDGEDYLKGHWQITPELALDVYHASRYKKNKRVTFYTDRDSISFLTEPDRIYDFAILLNNKDTAFTQISTKSPPLLSVRKDCNGCATSPDTIPFTFGRGDKVYLRASINNSVPLDLMFDLGSNQIVLSKEGLAKVPGMAFDETKANVAFGGQYNVQSSSINTLRIGDLVWDSVPVVRIDKADADGILGYNAFDGKMIAIDYDHQWLIVYPAPTPIAGDYQQLEMRFRGGLPFIEATLVNGNKRYTDYFEFDGGSNGSLWLNQAFASRYDLYQTMEKIGETTTQGLGGSTENQTVVFPKILIGNYELAQVPVDLELPSKQEHLQWGIFGMDVLKRFNVVIDFQNDLLYLKPNSLMHEPYHKPLNKTLLFSLVVVSVLMAGLFIYRSKRQKVKITNGTYAAYEN